MSWSEFPYLRASFAFAVGIFISEYFHLYYSNLDALCLLGLFIYFGLQYYDYIRLSRSYLYGLALMILISAFGVLTLQNHRVQAENNLSKFHQDKEVYFQAEITDILKTNSKFKFLTKIHLVHLNKADTKLVYINSFVLFDTSDTNAKKYKLGQTFLAHGKLKPIQTSKNPESFDYTTFLKHKDIYIQVVVKVGKHCLLNEESSSWFYGLALRAKDFTVSTLNKYIKNHDQLGVAEALLTGQKTHISEDVYYNFTNTGAIHVLSVSGLHVMIFMSLFIMLFDKVKRRSLLWVLIKVLSLLTIVWFYVVFTGMSPSVIRAGFMVSLYIVGKNMSKTTNSFNILAIAALSMLLYNPYYLFQASFQFSYISLLSILYFQPKIKTWFLPTQKATKFIWSLINVSLAAQVLVFPLTIFYFHKFPIYFMLSGLVAVPIVSFIIYLGSIILVIESVIPSLNEAIIKVFMLLLDILNHSIKYISNLPFSNVDNIWMSKMSLLLFSSLLIFLIAFLESKNKNSFYGILLFAFLIIFENRFYKYTIDNKSDMIVYDTYDGVLIDVFENGKLKSYNSDKISEKNITFVARNNRTSLLQALPNQVINLDSIKLFYFNEKLVYVYNSENDFKRLRQNINIDMLVISKAKGNIPESILRKLNPKWVILERNVPPWIIDKWLELPFDSERKIHQIKKDGAFSYSEMNAQNK